MSINLISKTDSDWFEYYVFRVSGRDDIGNQLSVTVPKPGVPLSTSAIFKDGKLRQWFLERVELTDVLKSFGITEYN